jgi:hypothetical protein
VSLLLWRPIGLLWLLPNSWPQWRYAMNMKTGVVSLHSHAALGRPAARQEQRRQRRRPVTVAAMQQQQQQQGRGKQRQYSTSS